MVNVSLRAAPLASVQEVVRCSRDDIAHVIDGVLDLLAVVFDAGLQPPAGALRFEGQERGSVISACPQCGQWSIPIRRGRTPLRWH